jgi:hypothetical protein
MTLIVTFLHPAATPEHLGPIPHWLDEDDPRPAAQQLDGHYQHGGGWRPMPKFKMKDRMTGVLTYPGDQPFRPWAAILFRKEMIFAYDHEIFAILQPDGSFEVARMD